MNASNDAPSDRYREKLLDAILEIAAESGWLESGVRKAAERAGLDEGQVMLACPNGASDLLEALGRRTARAAAARLAMPDVAAMKIREKVATGVRAYIAGLEPHKAAVRRAAGSTYNILTGPRAMWDAADAIWTAMGDVSTDFNWYTKRFTLSAVLGSTLLAWIGTDDPAEVDAFLDRRIENVMQFERTKKQAQDMFQQMPNPFDFLGRKPG